MKHSRHERLGVVIPFSIYINISAMLCCVFCLLLCNSLFKGSAMIVANMLIIEPNKFTQCAHILSRISFSCVHETC